MNLKNFDKSEVGWTFFTNHMHVLYCLSKHQNMVLREVAFRVGITERAVQRIISDLEESGHISIQKEGRQNKYLIHVDKFLKHPLESHCQVGDILKLLE